MQIQASEVDEKPFYPGDPDDHNPFADFWRESLLAGYTRCFVEADALTEASYRTVLTDAGWTAEDVEEFYAANMMALSDRPDKIAAFDAAKYALTLKPVIVTAAMSKAAKKHNETLIDNDPLASVASGAKSKAKKKPAKPSESKSTATARRKAVEDAKKSTTSMF